MELHANVGRRMGHRLSCREQPPAAHVHAYSPGGSYSQECVRGRTHGTRIAAVLLRALRKAGIVRDVRVHLCGIFETLILHQAFNVSPEVGACRVLVLVYGFATAVTDFSYSVHTSDMFNLHLAQIQLSSACTHS